MNENFSFFFETIDITGVHTTIDKDKMEEYAHRSIDRNRYKLSVISCKYIEESIDSG